MEKRPHRHERRSPAEVKLANQLTKLAATSKPDKQKFAAAAKITKAALKSPRFEFNRGYSKIDDLPIWCFHRPGETLTGILGAPGPDCWGGNTYPLVLDDKRVVRIPGNKRLQQLITKVEAVGKRVIIIYHGKRKGRHGYYEKEYELRSAHLERQAAQKAAQIEQERAEEKAQKEAAAEARKNRASTTVLEEAATQGSPFARELLRRKASGKSERDIKAASAADQREGKRLGDHLQKREGK